jgi:ABC-type lipoprotein export system ATPase subunit
MHREINLSGGEITLLKSLGLSGTPTQGRLLVEQIDEMGQAEFLDDLTGLISQGYVLADKVNIRTMEDVERSIFRVNASYARDLKDAVHPGHRREPERRRRRRG